MPNTSTISPPPELDKLTNAVAAFKQMTPVEQQQYAPKLQQYALNQYRAMQPSGYLATPEGQEVGHALRLNFGIKDALQGQAAPAQKTTTDSNGFSIIPAGSKSGLQSVAPDKNYDQAMTNEANSFWAHGGIKPLAPRQPSMTGAQMGQNMPAHIAALRRESSTSPAMAWAQGAGEGLAQVGSSALTQALAVARLPGMVANQVGGGSGVNFDPLADVGGNIKLPGGVTYDANTTPDQIKQFGHTLTHPREDPLQFAGAVATLALPALHMPLLKSALKTSVDLPSQAEVYERSNSTPAKPVEPVAEPTIEPTVKPVPVASAWKQIGPDMYSAPGGFHVSSDDGAFTLYGPKGQVLSKGHATPADAMDAVPSHATQPRTSGKFAGPPAPIEHPEPVNPVMEPTQPFEGQQHSVIGGPTVPPSKTAQAIANRAFPGDPLNVQESGAGALPTEPTPGDSGAVGQGASEPGLESPAGTRQSETFPPAAPEIIPPESAPEGAPTGSEAEVTPRIGMDEDALRAKAAEYAGGINVPRTGLTDEQMARVHTRAQALGLNDKTPVTDEWADDMAKTLGLSYDDMRGRPAGHVPVAPEGFTPEQWQKVWVRTIKGLHDQSEVDVTDAQNAVKDAEEAHGEAPTADTQNAIDAANQKYAEANDNSDLMTVHRSKLGSVSGVGLQAHVAPSFPIRGEGIRQGLLDAPTFEDDVPPKPTPAETTQSTPKTVRKGTNRASKFAPTTDEEFNAAVERTKARVGTFKDLAKNFVKSESGHFDMSQLPEAVRDLATIGKYYLERGVSKFGDWRAAVEAHSGALSDPDAQYTYQLARAARMKDVDAKQQSALKPLFVNALERDLGRKGAAQFLTDVGPEIRNKMIKGEDLTPHQDELYKAYRNIQKTSGKTIVHSETMKAVKDIIKSAPEAVARRKAAAAKAAATRKANAPPKPPKPPTVPKEREPSPRELRSERYRVQPERKGPAELGVHGEPSLPKTDDELFLSHVAKGLGPEGANKFRELIGEPLFEKFVTGTASPHERSVAAAAYEYIRSTKEKASPSEKPAAPGAQSLDTAVKAYRIANPTPRAPRASSLKVQGPPDPDTAFEQMVGSKVKGGRKAGAAVRADLESDAVGQSAKWKLLSGEDLTATEERRLGAAIDKYRRTTPTRTGNDIAKQLSKTISDYRAGRIGYDNPKEAVREQLMRYAKKGKDGKPDPEKVKAIGRDLAPVGDNDYDALAKVLDKHAFNASDWFDQYVLGNVLANPETLEKIGIAHPATISAEELRRFVNNPAESRAGVAHALHTAKTDGLRAAIDSLKHGPAYRQMTGKDIFHSHGSPLSVEHSLIAKPILRTHTAYYQFMGEYNYARGMHLEAWNEATQKGLTGAERNAYVEKALKHPTRAMQKKALEFAHEEAQTNPNYAADKTKQFIHSLPQPLRAVGTMLFPVLRIMANAFGRSVEMATGSFMSRQLADIYRKFHPTASAEDIAKYQRKVLHRGRIGAGLMLAGGIGKAAGVLNEPDKRKGRYSATINAFGKEIDLPAGNIGALPAMGAEAVAQVQKYMQLPAEQKTLGNVVRGVGSSIEPMSADMPYLRNVDTLKAIQDYMGGAPGSDKAASNVAAGFGSEVTPWSGAMNFAAKVGDPLHAVRGYANPSPIEAWARNMPILHNMEPTVNSPITGQPYNQSLWHIRPQEHLTPDQMRKQAGFEARQRAIDHGAQMLMEHNRAMGETAADYWAKVKVMNMMRKAKGSGSKW